MKNLLATLPLLLLINSSVHAEAGDSGPYAGISLEKAIEVAVKEFPGRVIEAEFEDGTYEVKILTSGGEKIKMKISPRDGTILRKGKVLKVTGRFGR